jgi:hypothetical protein
VIDWFVLFTPVLVLPVLLLCAFLGCSLWPEFPDAETRTFRLGYRRSLLTLRSATFTISVQPDPSRLGPEFVEVTVMPERLNAPPEPRFGSYRYWYQELGPDAARAADAPDTRIELSVRRAEGPLSHGTWTVRCDVIGRLPGGSDVLLTGMDQFSIPTGSDGRETARFSVVGQGPGLAVRSST